jgi:hypothetical protein
MGCFSVNRTDVILTLLKNLAKSIPYTDLNFLKTQLMPKLMVKKILKKKFTKKNIFFLIQTIAGAATHPGLRVQILFCLLKSLSIVDKEMTVSMILPIANQILNEPNKTSQLLVKKKIICQK